MLILTRRIGDSVVIGEEVYCTFLGIDEQGVRIGFDAPPTMPINRYEIHQRIYQANLNKNVDYLLDFEESVIDRLIAKFKRGKGRSFSHRDTRRTVSK